MDTNNKSRILLSLILILSLGTVVVYSAITLGTISQEGSVLETVNATQGYWLGTHPLVSPTGDINCSGHYLWHYGGTTYNVTDAIISALGVNATDEWGLVYGTTGDWFNYTRLEGAEPVYINVHIHPDNATLGVIPQVYDKDATHWQLSLYWYNGTQYNKDDVLVMYYAHIDWTNPTGDTYIEPNA